MGLERTRIGSEKQKKYVWSCDLGNVCVLKIIKTEKFRKNSKNEMLLKGSKMLINSLKSFDFLIATKTLKLSTALRISKPNEDLHRFINYFSTNFSSRKQQKCRQKLKFRQQFNFISTAKSL